MARFNIPIKPKFRWIKPLHSAFSGTTQAATAGDVMLALFEVHTTVMVDRIVWTNGGTAAGNIIVGIYGPVVTEETCAGSPVKVQSASTPMTGASQTQSIDLTPTVLTPCRYYAAIEFSDSTASYGREPTSVMVTGWSQFYARSGGFGALTDPCPAVTNQATRLTSMRIRCA